MSCKVHVGEPNSLKGLFDEENFALVRGLPSLNLKKGPGLGPLLAMYVSVANTGHNSPPVFPIYMCAPFLAWSVFDLFK